MTLSKQLKALANGINPETGEQLEKTSITHTAEVIRMLYLLSDELSQAQPIVKKKTKLTDEQRIAKNLKEGKPARSNLIWLEKEKALLSQIYKADGNIAELAIKMERSELAVACQLNSMNLIDEETVALYR